MAEELIDLATRAAHEAAAEIDRHRDRPGPVAAKSSATDPVTAADRAAEAAALALLRGARPGDGILSEEGERVRSATGFRWVVDALDGTVNFLYGVPHFAVSVACEKWSSGAWRTVAGTVYDSVRGEEFTGLLGGGAHLNGRSLAVNDPVPLPMALIATEFSYRAALRLEQAEVAARVLASARDIRSTGSSALDLCWVAAGRFDAFYENDLHRWDWAAGALIAAEAGGVVTELGAGTLAAGPSLHRELRMVVESASTG